MTDSSNLSYNTSKGAAIMYTHEQTYKTKEVAKLLDISVSTIRKYVSILEKKGYSYNRDKANNNSRLYTNDDIKALEYLKNLRDTHNLTVDNAASVVMSEQGQSYEVIEHKDNTQATHELKEIITNQNESMEQLTKLVSEQSKTILAMQSELKAINDKLDEQRQIEHDKHEKRGFFSRLFKK